MFMFLAVYAYRSQPARAVWIEIVWADFMDGISSSQPARAVWIEISMGNHKRRLAKVTACEGCVD